MNSLKQSSVDRAEFTFELLLFHFNDIFYDIFFYLVVFVVIKNGRGVVTCLCVWWTRGEGGGGWRVDFIFFGLFDLKWLYSVQEINLGPFHLPPPPPAHLLRGLLFNPHTHTHRPYTHLKERKTSVSVWWCGMFSLDRVAHLRFKTSIANAHIISLSLVSHIKERFFFPDYSLVHYDAPPPPQQQHTKTENLLFNLKVRAAGTHRENWKKKQSRKRPDGDIWNVWENFCFFYMKRSTPSPWFPLLNCAYVWHLLLKIMIIFSFLFHTRGQGRTVCQSRIGWCAVCRWQHVLLSFSLALGARTFRTNRRK